jgi:hypothetical protein
VSLGELGCSCYALGVPRPPLVPDNPSAR